MLRGMWQMLQLHFNILTKNARRMQMSIDRTAHLVIKNPYVNNHESFIALAQFCSDNVFQQISISFVIYYFNMALIKIKAIF